MQQIINEQLLEGIELFNRAAYFECHEVLEDLWRQTKEPERQFIQGIIQGAVALHHLLQGNKKGAAKLLTKALKRLAMFPDQYLGLELADFCEKLKIILEISQKESLDTQLENLKLPILNFNREALD